MQVLNSTSPCQGCPRGRPRAVTLRNECLQPAGLLELNRNFHAFVSTVLTHSCSRPVGTQVFIGSAHCQERNMVVPAARGGTSLLSVSVPVACVDVNLLSVSLPTASVTNSLCGDEAGEDRAG